MTGLSLAFLGMLAIPLDGALQLGMIGIPWVDHHTLDSIVIFQDPAQITLSTRYIQHVAIQGLRKILQQELSQDMDPIAPRYDGDTGIRASWIHPG